MTDGELVRQALDGQTAAYGELVRRWAAPVLAFCHARVGSADAAEDLAQETLLRGFRAINTLTDPDKFGPWLRGIALRVCLDWLKSRPGRQVTFGALAEDPAESVADRNGSPDHACDRAEQLQDLAEQVEALPEEYREVLMLYYHTDATYQDLANMLGVSAATINARLTKARAMLRRRLSRAWR
jgi:RNA polymerase sigma-70 factor (ECF subfamily)